MGAAHDQISCLARLAAMPSSNPNHSRMQSQIRCTAICSPSLPHPMQLRTPLQSQTRRCPAHCQLLSQRDSSCLRLRAQPAPPAGLQHRRNFAPQITFWAQAAQASLPSASTAGGKQRCIKIITLPDASPHAGWPHCGPGPHNGGLLCDGSLHVGLAVIQGECHATELLL